MVVDSGVPSCLCLSLHPTSASRVTGNGGDWDGRLGSLGDLAEGISAQHAHIMSDAGLAGPLPELLFPSVLLATALIFFV